MAKGLIHHRLSWRASAAPLVHAVVFAAIYWFAYWNAYAFRLRESTTEWPMFWLTLPAVLIVKLICFYAAGCYHRSFHHIAFSDVWALLGSATLATLVIMALNNQVMHEFHIPPRALLLDWGLTILALGCLRALSERIESTECRVPSSG